MARERILKSDQTHFSEECYKLGNGNYFTDIDSVVLANTENNVFQQYGFKEGRPQVKRFIEIKHKLTTYIENQITKKSKPNAQTYSFAYLCSELNYFRQTDSTIPNVDFYFIIQNEGEYPYNIYEVTEKDGEITYTFKTTVDNYKEFEVVMKQ